MYTLLSALISEMWASVLGIKDTFFCVPLTPESQDICAFEWLEPGQLEKIKVVLDGLAPGP